MTANLGEGRPDSQANAAPARIGSGVLRARLVGTVFFAIAPAWVLMYLFAEITHTDIPWMPFVVGLLALGAAWYGGERFIMRQVRTLHQSARQLAAGDFKYRTGLSNEAGELGDLARILDDMAASLEERIRERERTEQILINRSFQQTVVSALGQFALANQDFSALLDQTVLLVAQTLEVQYVQVLELQPDSKLLLRAGTGWRADAVGTKLELVNPPTQMGFTLTAGEPVIVLDLPGERRFASSSLLTEHGVVSGVTVAITGSGPAYGVLGVHTTAPRRFTEDEVHFLMAVATVLAMAVAHKRAQEQTEKLASFAQLNPNPAMELAAGGTLTYCNAAAQTLARSLGEASPDGILPPDCAGIVQQCLERGQGQVKLEAKLKHHTLSWSFHPVASSGVVHAYVEDTTHRLSLEAQLRQSQKMESVGQLAAGVAHDFNNMLAIIQGHAGLLTAKAGNNPVLQESAQAISYAAERAANLTRQLLMFSRKNVMQPTDMDLRTTVTNLSKMLSRMLGETIRFQVVAQGTIPNIHADAGMVEQVVMNLAVNARDAMPKGGTLTISTSPVDIGGEYVETHPDAREGAFVCLRVSDTGCGIPPDIMARIFEPFFTTKDVGKGTGLGLATVYGIIKQHEGWIEVESEPGLGTTFSIFFPAGNSPVQPQIQATTAAPKVQRGKETILLVEDEPLLREMAHVILEDCGYRILDASSGSEALAIWQCHQHTIDLVLTDMVMPEGISGMDLAEKVHATSPRTRIVFASGYSMDDIDPEFVQKGYATFIQKPYTNISLPQAVRDCLDKAPAIVPSA